MSEEIVIVSYAGGSPALEAECGTGPLALRRKQHRKWGWWCSPASRSAARFSTECEARSWVYRTFKSPVDHTNLHTIERRVLEAAP